MQITVNKVSVTIDDILILKDINLTLNNRRIGIVGCNGSGKSTFLKLLNGLIIPSEGSVFVNGLDTKKKSKEIRRDVGFLFQNPDNQIIMPTVSEELLLGLSFLGFSEVEKKNRLEEVINLYNLSNLIDRPSHSLSGGEKQLLALAAVMITKPKILVCDEPTTLLDFRNERVIMDNILRLDCNVILVSHNLDYFKSFDEILLIDKGSVVNKGVPGNIINKYIELMK